MNKISKISLIGMGAMGSFFAPSLYNAYGDNFRIIANKTRKDRLEQTGVTINGINYHFPIIKPEETDNQADLIIIATKGYQFDQAMEDIANQVGENTIILGIINGIDAEDKLIKRFGSEHVLYSLMRVSIVMKDLISNYDPNLGNIYFGEKYNEVNHYSARVQLVQEVFETAHINYHIEQDMIRAIWYKFACNVSENLTCALLGLSFGWFQNNQHANAIREKAFWEVAQIAQAVCGKSFTKEDLIKQQKVLNHIPAENKPSTLQDIEALKPTEIDMFAKRVVELGKIYNIETPYSEFFYHGISILEEKNNLLKKNF